MTTHLNATTTLNLFLQLSLASVLLLTFTTLLTCTLLRRTSAATRHLTWTAACLSLLCLPLFALLPTPTNLPPALTPLPRLSLSLPPLPPPDSIPTQSVTPTPAASRFTFSRLQPLLLPLYTLGLLTSLTPLLLSPLLLHRLKRRSTLTTDQALLSTLHDCQHALNFRQLEKPLFLYPLFSILYPRSPIPLLLSDSPTTMPLTFGLFRPHILLPSSAPTWPQSQLRQVLSHELAHIKRRDCLTLYLAQLARALHWFNPLAWHAVSRMLAERERACDDLVLASTTTLPSDYANTLLHLTASLRPAPRLLPAMPMSRPSHLHTRLLAILDPHRNRSPLTRRLTCAVLLLTPLLALPLACTPNPKPTQPPIAGTQRVPGDDAKYGWTPETTAAAQNLKWIGQAILLYANEHKNALPPTLGDSLASLDGLPTQNALHFLDPRDHVTIPANPTPDWINKHTPYIYLGRPDLLLSDLPNPDNDAATTILVHEDLARPHTVPNHPPVIVALYNDGHGELLPLDDARRQIESSKQTIAHPPTAGTQRVPGDTKVDQYGWTNEMNLAQGPMRDIATAAYAYASSDKHNHRLPATLGDTLSYLDRNHAMSRTDQRHATPAEKAKLFVDPRDYSTTALPATPTPDWVNAHTSYTYLGRPDVDPRSLTDDQLGQIVLLHDNLNNPHHHPQHGPMIICAYLDGHSEGFPIAQAKTLIAQSQQTLANAANKPPLPPKDAKPTPSGVGPSSPPQSSTPSATNNYHTTLANNRRAFGWEPNPLSHDPVDQAALRAAPDRTTWQGSSTVLPDPSSPSVTIKPQTATPTNEVPLEQATSTYLPGNPVTKLYVPDLTLAQHATIEHVRLPYPGAKTTADPQQPTPPRELSFELGRSDFLPGDSITILKVLDLTPPKSDLTLARTFQVTGTYTLASHPDARLGAEITSNDPASGKGSYTPITKGANQPFSLTFTLAGNGNPHVSFYPAHERASSFGSIYFGSGPSLYK